MSTQRRSFRGNKTALPSKPCAHCSRPMSWRKAWAKNWPEVRYCSDACRRGKVPVPVPAPGAPRIQAQAAAHRAAVGA